MSKIYIELGEAINAIKSSRGNCDHRFYDEGLMDACSELIGLKPADVKPVVHGMWRILDNTEYGIDVECSECKNKAFFSRHSAAKFCPNCGATMDGGNK
jgi:hypothetical protein